ncbi:MAG: FAD-binding oxidoreductase, partial [Acidobacteria bacterium]|nr:FAD-binding oxidoreductase [Acidobacteriota bacterium]
MIESIEQFDAVVIGGGVIGCSIAWRLGQAGMRIAVLERGSVGVEASRAAGGILSPLAEADRADDFFRLCMASRAMYADFARELRDASGIDIEYRTEGIIYLALTEEDEEELDRRWEWQHRAGLNVKRLNAECVRKLEPHVNEKLRWALKFPDDHQVNNLRLAKALEMAAQKSHVTFLTHTEATSLLFDGSSVRGVKTHRNELRTDTVIIAAGSWSTQHLEPVESQDFHIVPVRGQMLAIEMPAPPIQHV